MLSIMEFKKENLGIGGIICEPLRGEIMCD